MNSAMYFKIMYWLFDVAFVNPFYYELFTAGLIFNLWILLWFLILFPIKISNNEWMNVFVILHYL